MNRNFRTDRTEEPAGAAPSEAWLFAQAILGKPIPDPAAKMKQARAEREHLEWLAQISTEHEAQLRKLQSAEAEARHQRERLEWLAQISTEHEAKLRRLKAEEYEAQEAQQRWEHYYQEYSANVTEWNEVDHPRQPKGTPDGGQWAAKGGGGAGTASDGGHDIGQGRKHAEPKIHTVSSKAPDTGAIWKGSVIAAKGRGLPTPLLDWNAVYGTRIVLGSAPKFQPGRLWGATLELDEFNIQRLGRIGKADRFDVTTDITALGNVYNEAFHAWFWGNKSSLGWLLAKMKSQKQFGDNVELKSEEAMSECINQVINDLESGQPILSYDGLMKLKPSDSRRQNLAPGHNEPKQDYWGKGHAAGSEMEMSEELYYATIWVLYNGNKNPAPIGGNQLAATKKFFASKFHPAWTPQQVQQFVNSRYKKN